MKLKLVEPLNELFKDEVRKLGRSLGLDDSILQKHPFPGPGLAIRIPGKITEKKIKILQEVDEIYINSLKENDLYKPQKIESDDIENKIKNKNKTINQIKNFSQEEISKPEKKIEAELIKTKIKNFDELIDLCNKKKELKLKYELETNVSPVSFADQKIEISFNQNLDKNFVKELSFKLHEWTGKRWIIAFSKEIGKLSKKDKKYLDKTKIIEETKNEEIYKKILESFPDAELVDVKLSKDE